MADPSNKKIMDLLVNPDPSGSWTYVVESGTNYRVQLGVANGVAVLNGIGVLTPVNGGTGIASYTPNNYLRALDATTLEQRTPAQVRADIGAGTGSGSVTSVDIDDATGITFTGGPITGSGVFTPALSANLQAWSGLATSAKQDASANLTAWSAIATSTKLNTNNPTYTGTLTGPGGTFSSGINFGSNAATGVDLSQHIALFGTSYGFNIISGAIQAVHNGVSRQTWTSNGITVNGTIIASGNITANNSDERLKKEIRTIEGGLDIVNALRGVRYVKDGEECVGVIAQEVREVLPEVVVEQDDEMKTLAVGYGNIVAPLIEAVKELSAHVTTLIHRVDELETQLGVK